MKAFELEKLLGKKKRKTISDLKLVLKTLARENPNFCLFLGAGASRSSGIRTAGEMVKNWREQVYKSLTDKQSFTPDEEIRSWLIQNESDWYSDKDDYASLIEKIYGTQTNRRKFIEEEVSDKIPSIGYAYLVRIAEAGLLRTIFTTNFDDLLNEAFYQFSSERPIVCAHDSSVQTISITSRRTKIIKLHGDYLFDDLKNTKDETLNLEKNMRDKLAEFLKEYGLILAGYSGSDRSITRNLLDMLENPQYLQNGLYWCFRDEDMITERAIEILERPNAFYVLTSGFDELMAELYGLVTESTPFNSKLASDRASHVIDSYLTNSTLKTSTSKTIQRHLETLESDKNATLVSDMMRELNSERIASAGLSDQNLLVYLEIERELKERNLEKALARLEDVLKKTTDKRFKELLLHRRFICSLRLHRIPDAKDTVKNMLLLEPANYYVALSECSLQEDRADRLKSLGVLKDKNPFSSVVLNEYADEQQKALDSGEKSAASIKPEAIIENYTRSTQIDPSLTNPAWTNLFSIHAKTPKLAKSKDSMESILRTHLSRDGQSSETSAIFFQYCRATKTLEFEGRQLLTHLNDSS